MATRYKQIGEIYLINRHHFCFWVLEKDEKRIKTNFYLELYESRLQLFSNKSISPNASKTFATEMFFIDHLKSKTARQWIKQLEQLPQQILTNYGYISCRNFQMVWLLKHLGFPDLFGKVFWALLYSPNLIFSSILGRSNEKKILKVSLALSWNEILTV